MQVRPTRSTVVVLLLLGLLASCDKPPTAPGATGAQNPPPPPPAETVTRIEMTGPDTIAPDQTVQLSAIATLSDGTTRTLTSEAFWGSSNLNVLSISAGGLLTVKTRGEATIRVTYRTATATRTVFGMPPGTYRLTGLVREATTYPVSNVRVEVLSGAGAGLAVTTTDSGTFRLYGVAGDTRVRVTREDFEPETKSIDINAHGTLNFELKPNRPYTQVAGTYRVTFAASCENGALTEELKRRTYTAVVSQEGPRIDVTLQGADFALDPGGRGNRLSGRLEGNLVRVFLADPWSGYYYYYGVGYPSVVERIGTKYLSLTGILSIAVDGSALGNGTLSGNVVETDAPPASRRPSATCFGRTHQFSFARIG